MLYIREGSHWGLKRIVGKRNSGVRDMYHLEDSTTAIIRKKDSRSLLSSAYIIALHSPTV